MSRHPLRTVVVKACLQGRRAGREHVSKRAPLSNRTLTMSKRCSMTCKAVFVWTWFPVSNPRAGGNDTEKLFVIKMHCHSLSARVAVPVRSISGCKTKIHWNSPEFINTENFVMKTTQRLTTTRKNTILNPVWNRESCQNNVPCQTEPADRCREWLQFVPVGSEI